MSDQTDAAVGSKMKFGIILRLPIEVDRLEPNQLFQHWIERLYILFQSRIGGTGSCDHRTAAIHDTTITAGANADVPINIEFVGWRRHTNSDVHREVAQ